MKKLIEELEAYVAKSKKAGQSNGYILGLRTALQIVRTHNPWHEVAKNGLPEPDKLLWFLCRDRSVYLGYYASYKEDGKLYYFWSEQDGMAYRWDDEITIETSTDDDYDVTHYRYIPTDLPEVTP